VGGRPNRILAIVVGAIVVLATAVVTVSAKSSTADYDPGTPEGTVQAYLRAVTSGDYAEAATFLDPAGDCDVEDLDRAGGSDSARVYLVRTGVEGDTATVTVDVTRPSGGPLDTAEYTETHLFRLTRSDGDWRLSGTPWPLYNCEGDVK
jgi:hypothetical protein